MTIAFDVTPQEFTIIHDILRDTLPAGTRVWVFGSRAKTQARHNSDIDIAIEDTAALPALTLHILKEAFSDSLLPYTVDIADVHAVSPEFKAIIEQQCVAFPLKRDMHVPELRFPEFLGDWERSTLGAYYTFKNGINADKSSYGKGHKFINVLDIISSQPITHSKIIGFVDIKSEEYDKNTVLYGDMLFQRSSETRNEVGQSNVYLDSENSATFGGFVIRGRPVKEHEPKFFNFLLKTDAVRCDMTSRSGGSTRYNIGQYSLSLVPIVIPLEITEQQKVAAFLSAVDDRIALLEERKSLQESYKKGCMQQLFSQTIRFKDDNGRDFLAWEEKKLGDVCAFLKGKGISKADIHASGANKCIRYGELYTTYNGNISNVISRTNTSKNKSILSKNNDILMPTSDVTPTGLATSSALNFSDIIIGGDILIIRTEDILNTYFCYFISCNKNVVIRLVSGVTVYHIYASDMKTLKITIPSLPEQQKIADFLTAIDDKIMLIQEEITQTQAFKNALLQRMFV